ncbi:MAG: M23 family metallopeptidase [Jhaorihella sp.]
MNAAIARVWRWLAGMSACVTLALAVTGCGIEKYGSAVYYDGPERTTVILPPGAPYISQQFSEPVEQGSGGHIGIDIWGALRSPVLAAAPGLVTASFYEPAYGNRIVVDHGRDAGGARHWTVYKHLKERLVASGDRVARGERIATMGATGALGMMVHLHFEVLEGEDPRYATPRDPQLFWVQGPGRVTCFDPRVAIPARRFVTTYPVACRDG